MTYFIKCGVCGQLFDPKGEPPKSIESPEEGGKKNIDVCQTCYEKMRDGRDSLYHLLERK